jgi:hypothetical protein
MKRLELYSIRAALIAIISAIAISPFVAVTHIVNGVAQASMHASHLLAIGYLLLIAGGLLVVSPVFRQDKH